MSNSQWHADQAEGERALRKFDQEREADKRQRAIADELRQLLSAFLDERALVGHSITREQWERACLLCGRWCAPFISHPGEP